VPAERRKVVESPHAAVLLAPTFSLGIRCDADAVIEIEFLDPCAAVEANTPLASETVRQLRCWLEDADFVFDLPLAPAGTEFQRRVWHQIARIPRGETRSYGEIACTLDSAPRAVGGACGANPFPVIIPCHRVIGARGENDTSGAKGGLGGFARARGGFLLDVKRWLLQHESR